MVSGLILRLDDPLSAVDAHVGKHIFQKVLSSTGILKNNARVLVTHSINFLPETDQILLLKSGQILEHGKYAELMNDPKGLVFALMKEYGKKKDDNAPAAVTEEVLGSCTDFGAPMSPKSPKVDSKKNGESNKKVTLIAKEESAVGAVSWSVYKTYMDSCGLGMVIGYLCIVLVTNAISIGQNVFLADWASANDGLEDGQNSSKSDIIFRLAVYGALGIVFSFSTVFQTIFIWVFCGMKSAKLLHEKMLDNMMRLPQAFFDVTPLGRILNRFSKDQNCVDEVCLINFSRLML